MKLVFVVSNVVRCSMANWLLQSVFKVPGVIWGRIFPSGGYCQEPLNELSCLEPHMTLKNLIACY